ncbi:MAG: SLATT domain-containing protein [Bacteroidales bacterium]|nr:SLATT domain-containing protein [Bacteroidales bacterium]
MAKETLLALQKLKVDCLYKKSTHFNAARRIKRSSNVFQLFLIIGTIFAAFSTIMNVGIWDKIPCDTLVIQVIVNVLGALGGFLILYTTTFSDYKSKIDTANKHDNVGNDLNLIFKNIRNTEAAYIDDLITDDQLLKTLNDLTTEYVAKCYSAPITEKEDFEQAREDYKNGYLAEYTDEELKC